MAESRVDELGQVTRLLQTGFQVAPDASILDRQLLYWKYHENNPDWAGSRSFVVRDGDQVVAHASVWPQYVLTPEGSTASLGFYDWVSHPDYRGAGIQLVKELLARNPVMLVVGGAEITRKILPRLGFSQVDTVSVYARVLRPWKQFRTRPTRRGWREAGRVGRNLAWSIDSPAPTGKWRAKRIEGSTPEQLAQLEQQATVAGTLHSTSFIDYYLKCPVVPIHLYELAKEGESKGYFALSCVDGQVRILDLRVIGPQSDWTAACSVALLQAKKETQAVELIAWSSTPRMKEALEQNRFQLRDTRPLFVYDPQGQITPHFPLQVGMLDDDSGFLSIPGDPYLT